MENSEELVTELIFFCSSIFFLATKLEIEKKAIAEKITDEIKIIGLIFIILILLSLINGLKLNCFLRKSLKI